MTIETTEVIGKAVLPHFEEANVSFDIVRRDAVLVRIPIESGAPLNVLVTDQEFGVADVIEASIYSIAKFPEDRMPVALLLCNALNQATAVGKFFVTPTGGVAYKLDWSARSLNPDETGLLMAFTIAAIDKFYPAIMSVRWGNVPIAQALEGLKDNGGDDGGESAAPPALSDYELRRLIGGLDPEGGEDGA